MLLYPQRRRQLNISKTKEDSRFYISIEVLKKILSFLKSDVSIELGGFLLGKKNGDEIRITRFYEAKHTDSTEVSLYFTPETWLDYDDFVCGIRSEGLLSLGWVHSHPNLGVFLSQQDENVNIVFDHLAIVYDPVRNEIGFFDLSKPKRVLCPVYIVFTSETTKGFNQLTFTNYFFKKNESDEKASTK